MSVPKVPGVEAISCHAFNGDGTQVALCPNSAELWIYSGANNPDPTKWKREFVLKEHDLMISGVDWSPVSNQIVTCSHDRNAFVWTFDGTAWTPQLVILRINRAATAVRWSPDGKKFAVASGSKQVPVCHYEEFNDWWISKMIKKHKSTVLDLAWHPNSQLLATGCSDNKARIFSAYVSEVDASVDPGPLGLTDLDFGELLADFDQATGWVESVAWSPSGTRLAFVSHDSSLHVVHFGEPGEAPTVQTLKEERMPYTCVDFISESVLVAAGHDCMPAVFNESEGFWSYEGWADPKTKVVAAKKAGFSSARTMFETKVSRAGADGSSSGKAVILDSKHQNLIMCLRAGGGSKFSTSGLDGRLVAWDLADVKELFAKLSL